MTKTKIFGLCVLLITLTTSCVETKAKTEATIAITTHKTTKILKPKTTLNKEFNDYWYGGKAEITSYKLEQARYGEMRNGKAVLVFVTEDFLPDVQVKADNYNKNNIPVLKLNATKNFNTGIYPYSIMQSTFYPVANNQHAVKISASVQEWCGHVYAQLNNRDNFEITAHSYFESEADQNVSIDKTWTENELWTKLRIDPKSLPVGHISIIPALEYTRLKHIDIKGYNAVATLTNGYYKINYPNLNRS
ncbi:MAG: septum formation inhibitor Maf, partial [Winogradskyella sp.]